MKGIIFDLKRFAVHDGPGIRTTVFLKGCPLDCAWCHNPESIATVISEMPKNVQIGTRTFFEMEQVGREVTDDQLMRELLKDRIFWEESGGGVTFSGGEPLLQHRFLKELLKVCQAEKIHTAVDTSGYASTDVWNDIMPFVNLFLFDLKLMDDKLHQTNTGVSNKTILKNLHLLSQKGIPYRLRLPMIPEVTATAENQLLMIRFIQTLENPPQGIDLLPFHRAAEHKYQRLGKDNPFFKKRLLNQREMDEAAERFQKAGYSVHIGG